MTLLLNRLNPASKTAGAGISAKTASIDRFSPGTSHATGQVTCGPQPARNRIEVATNHPLGVGSDLLLFQKALRIERRHAAGAGTRDCLAVDVVLHVAGGEHAGHTGHCRHAGEAALGDEVAVFHLQLALEDVGVRLVADRDEAPGQLQLDLLAAGGALQAHAGHAGVVAEHFVEGLPQVQLHLALRDLRMQLVDQDRLGAKLVAAVDQVHLAGDVRQVQRLFDRGVAAADDADLLPAVEEPVAGRATADAAAHELLFRGQPDVLGRGTGREDQRIAGVAARVAFQYKRPLAQVDRVDVVEHDLGVETLGVLLEALHQVGSHHAVDVGGPVVDIGRRHQLAALRDAGDQHRLEVRSGGIDGGGIAGRAGAEDQDVGVSGGCAHGIRVVVCAARRGIRARRSLTWGSLGLAPTPLMVTIQKL